MHALFVKCNAQCSYSLLAVGGPEFLLDGFPGGFGKISGLYILLDAHERLLESIEGAGVQHLLLDLWVCDIEMSSAPLLGNWLFTYLGSIGTPRHKEQLLLL